MSDFSPEKRMIENAQKLTYMLYCYPTKTIMEIINFFQLPPIHINAAIWKAEDMGYISKADPETGMVEILSSPEPFEFGDTVEELMELLKYSFDKLSAEEKDLEENYLNQWLAGYGSHDHIVAMKYLLNNGVLAEYTVSDQQFDGKGKPVLGEDKEPLINEYVFYTKAGCEDNRWGERRFKTPPVAPEK